MIRYNLIHPEILSALAQAGHGSQIVLANANYSVSTNVAPNARRVFLNLAPGVLSITDILKVLVNSIVIESASGMTTVDGNIPSIASEYQAALPQGTPMRWLSRFEFYDAAKDGQTTLVIASGEQRLYTSLILTVGVVQG